MLTDVFTPQLIVIELYYQERSNPHQKRNTNPIRTGLQQIRIVMRNGCMIPQIW